MSDLFLFRSSATLHTYPTQKHKAFFSEVDWPLFTLRRSPLSGEERATFVRPDEAAHENSDTILPLSVYGGDGG